MRWMKLNEKLIYLRKQKGFSQTKLAETVGVSRQTVSKWELGIVTPAADNLESLGCLFEVSVDDLLNDQIEIQDIKSKCSPPLESEEAISSKPAKKTAKGGRLVIICMLGCIIALLAILLIAVFKPKGNDEISLGSLNSEMLDISSAEMLDISPVES